MDDEDRTLAIILGFVFALFTLPYPEFMINYMRAALVREKPEEDDEDYSGKKGDAKV